MAETMNQTQQEQPKRKRILSGIQPTGTPTLGNYMGAVRNWALLQKDYDCLYMVAESPFPDGARGARRPAPPYPGAGLAAAGVQASTRWAVDAVCAEPCPGLTPS